MLRGGRGICARLGGRFVFMFRGALIASIVVVLAGCGGATRLEGGDDDCLDDPNKVAPGICGCGIPEARCLALKDALIHRYAFDGSGALAVDEVGGADGTIKGATLGGLGQLDLARDGELEQYVDLPNGIISSLSSATFEAWIIWQPPSPLPFWERIFDFGVSTAGEDKRETGKSYIFLAPGGPGNEPDLTRTAFQDANTLGEVRVNAMEIFPTEKLVEVAVVVDAAAQELRLYLDSREQPKIALTEPLSALEDVNNWLGRSQFAKDQRFGGSFLEFRIYDKALTQAELVDSYAFGDSPDFLRK